MVVKVATEAVKKQERRRVMPRDIELLIQLLRLALPTARRSLSGSETRKNKTFTTLPAVNAAAEVSAVKNFPQTAGAAFFFFRRPGRPKLALSVRDKGVTLRRQNDDSLRK